MVPCQFCANPSNPCYDTNGPMCSDLACWGKLVARDKAADVEAAKDGRVMAIRTDKAVGHGTCSTIDECYSDSELLSRLVANGIATPLDAVKWAREVDGLHWESGLNQMFGDDGESDQQIRACYEESKELAKLPIDVE